MDLIVILEDNDTFSGLPAWLANPDEEQIEEMSDTPICQLERPLAKVEIGRVMRLVEKLASIDTWDDDVDPILSEFADEAKDIMLALKGVRE